MPKPESLTILVLGAVLWAQGCSPPAAEPPPPDPTVVSDPVTQDPSEIDDAFPPVLVESPEGLASGGHRLNGILYLANGPGPHPTAVLLHGLPGNERNVDLAHALRRGGWNVAFFHYRGAWGSEGTFSFVGNVDDIAAMVEYLRGATARTEYRVDGERLVLIGHSMGGGTALVAAARDPGIRAVVSLAGADLGRLGELDGEPRERFAAYLESLLALDVPSGAALLDEVAAGPVNLHLESHAAALAEKSLLLVIGARDTVVDAETQHRPLVEALEAAGAADLTEVVLDADHGFSSRRIELARTVLAWLGERFELDELSVVGFPPSDSNHPTEDPPWSE